MRQPTSVPLDAGFAAALAAHDAAVAAAARPIWVGAEPTYTDRLSEAPEWLFAALGEDKRGRAERMLASLAGRAPGAVVLRTVGRQYPGEPEPRWTLGLYARRDAVPIWHGPPDPIVSEDPPGPPNVSPDGLARAFARALARRLEADGSEAAVLRVDAPLPERVAYRLDGTPPPRGPDAEPRLARGSVHDETEAPPGDDLAAQGTFLVCLGAEPGATAAARAELPAIDTVPAFLALIAALGDAAQAAGIERLVIAGHPPPVDATVEWTTLAPDPGVLEVNLAPSASASEFAQRAMVAHTAARGVELSAYRLGYNGVEGDSGGGGQITLGGPSVAQSPFFVYPSLLPSLVRYVNRHPSLSYLFAPDSAGASSQAPRADEGDRTALRELDLALALLARIANPSPEMLARALAPFMTDPSGNTHRAEINVEKLWSAMSARARLGLVELRAFRMSRTAEALAATGAFVRAIAAMLAKSPWRGRLVDWGDRLHDEFSLPFFLRADLFEVLSDLDRHGLGLGPPLVTALSDSSHRSLARIALPGAAVLELSTALEFWPLVGDVAGQERGTSRLVDASTAKIELLLRPAGDRTAHAFERWTATVASVDLPLVAAADREGRALVAGVRYRTFAPERSLHPTLAAQVPLELGLHHRDLGSWRITMHQWRPDGAPYSGLPVDLPDAAARRAERCVVEPTAPVPPRAAPRGARGRLVLDLRWVEP